MTTEKILEILRDEAYKADIKAMQACKKSKYSIQDYWMCLEFKLQQIHDRIARESNIPYRCPLFSFRKKLNDFKKIV